MVRNSSRVLLSWLMLAILSPRLALARIPEHPAQVNIPRLARDATILFRGAVSTIVPGTTNHWGTKDAIAQFVVDRWYRGMGPALVEVRFSYNSDWSVNGHDCIDFQPGSHWIVFAKGEAGPLQLVHDCEGALPVSSRLASELPNSNDVFPLMLADFAAGLQDGSSEARITSIQRLGNLRSPQALPFLQPLLQTRDGEEYEWAVYAALRSGDSRVLPAVKEFLQKYPDQRMPEFFMPREIMDTTDKAAIPDLLALLDGNPRVQAVALIALGRIGDRGVLPTVAPHLADTDRSVRYQALALLSKVTKAQACDIAPSSSDEEMNAKERECLAWWQQVGAVLPR